MLSFFHVRPSSKFVPACAGIPFGCRGYAKRRLPDPSGLNYDILMKLVEGSYPHDALISNSAAKGVTDREREAGSETKNHFKVRAFDSALQALEALQFRIQRVEDMQDVGLLQPSCTLLRHRCSFGTRIRYEASGWA